MPKRNAETYDSDNGFVEDAPPTKSTKKSKIKSAATIDDAPAKTLSSTTKSQTDENGDRYWPLNGPGTRRITINKFKNKWMVNVREYYEANGEMKPGKKGITLPLEQYSSLVSVLPQIEMALSDEGESVPRPDYAAAGAPKNVKEEQDEEEESEVEDAPATSGRSKANHEATSEEED